MLAEKRESQGKKRTCVQFTDRIAFTYSGTPTPLATRPLSITTRSLGANLASGDGKLIMHQVIVSVYMGYGAVSSSN